MAQITASTSEKVFQIKAWSGLHESPDGDTKLKLGEAATIENFRVTRDGNLQRRPGYRELVNLGTGKPVVGMWRGYANKKEVLLAACNGHVYSLWDDANGDWYRDLDGDISPKDIGTITTTGGHVTMFGFEGKVYFMNGSQYRVWDGTNNSIADVVGYVPLVAISIEPSPNAGMGGQLLEQVNKLSAWRRVWLSADGVGDTFYLPEKGIVYDTAADVVVTNLGTNTQLTDTTDYTVNKTDGKITFTSVPAKAVNGYEVKYHMATDFSSQVKAMKYAEIFSGQTDSRVFIYGDGTNEVFYSSIDYYGTPTATYFPDLNEAAIGDANTPVTALIRHYSKLVVFKSDSTWSLSFSSTTLADGNMTEALYIYPVNKRLGNTPMGQVALVLNAPRSLYGNDCYEWRNNNAYSANLSVDERQAKRISDRVYASLNSFDLKSSIVWDDNDAQEYWICQNGKALVHNYAVDAWYYYTNIPATCFANFHETLYFGDGNGSVQHFDELFNSDNGEVIDAHWESGNMAFNADYMRKYSARMWIGIKPTSAGKVNVTVQTDRKVASTEKIVVSKLATLANVNFADWSFNTNQQPQIKKLKLKAKKFVYYKLIFFNDTEDTSATITTADIRVRYTGDAK